MVFWLLRFVVLSIFLNKLNVIILYSSLVYMYFFDKTYSSLYIADRPSFYGDPLIQFVYDSNRTR